MSSTLMTVSRPNAAFTPSAIAVRIESKLPPSVAAPATRASASRRTDSRSVRSRRNRFSADRLGEFSERSVTSWADTTSRGVPDAAHGNEDDVPVGAAAGVVVLRQALEVEGFARGRRRGA